MREYTTAMSEYTKAGIKPYRGSNIVGWESCLNARPIVNGAEYIIPYTAFMDLVTTFPFPQLVALENTQFVCTSANIFQVVAGSLANQYAQSVSQHYCVADFKTAFMFCASGKTVFKIGDGSFSAGTNAPQASTCCSFNGLPVLGNITSWNQISDEDSSTLVWGRPLSSDFTIHSSGRPTGVGYRKLQQGKILKVLDWNKQLIVFCEKGITVLELVSSPLPVFVPIKTLTCTVNNKESVVAARDYVLFLDKKGFLNIFKDGTYERLGYEAEFLSSITQYGESALYGSYNPIEAECYLSTHSKTYVYTSSGLGEIDQTITSGGLVGGDFECVANTPSSDDFEVVYNQTQLNTSTHKTVTGQEVLGESDKAFQVGVAVKGDTGLTFLDLPYVDTSPEGVGILVVEGRDFRFKVKVTAPDEVRLFGHIIRWKQTDKRNLRSLPNVN